MSRPSGEPGVVAAGARSVGAAAGALRDVGGRLGGATSFVVAAGAWRGPASEAFLVDGAELQAGLHRASDALGQAAGALAELAARLEQAQATWDRARRLAASAGVELDDHGGLVLPSGTVDAAQLFAAGQAVRQAAAAADQAAAARRFAAARRDHAAALAPAPAQGSGGRGPSPPDGVAPHRTGHGGEERGWGRRVAGRVLEAGGQVVTATHHLAAGAEARVRAAGRLAAAGDDPAVRSAAARVAETSGRSLLDGRALSALPVVAPVLDFAAGVSDGEPFARAAVGAIGGALGADVGGRVGLAVCGGQAAATQGVGRVLCPALTAVGGAVGAQAGKEAALHIYDAVAGPPDPDQPPEASR
jgi:uncharacterized protein YukE